MTLIAFAMVVVCCVIASSCRNAASRRLLTPTPDVPAKIVSFAVLVVVAAMAAVIPTVCFAEDQAAPVSEQPPAETPIVRPNPTHTVILLILVLENGRVGAATVAKSSGDAYFDNEAISLARDKFHYEPATQGGRPVKFWGNITVVFDRFGNAEQKESPVPAVLGL